MPGRPAGGDDDPVDALDLLIGKLQAVDTDVAGLLEQVAAHGVLDRLRLLEDLLEHEVLEATGFVGGDHADAVGTVDVAQRRRDGFLEVALVKGAHEVGEDLGVGFGLEDVAAVEQRLLDGRSVLDDAVVDQGDPSRLVGVRMGIDGGWSTMGGPTGVADTGGAVRGTVGDLIGENAELAGRLADLEAVPVQHRDPGGIVAAVFHAPQTLHEDRRRLPWPDISHNSAHSCLVRCVPRRSARRARLRHQGFCFARRGRLGDQPDDRLRPRGSHMQPPVGPRQPQAIPGIRLRIGEGLAQGLVEPSEIAAARRLRLDDHVSRSRTHQLGEPFP